MINSSLKIKFFITPVYPYGNDHYYHEMIAVAEGFKELGYTIMGNADYWFMPEENQFLIPFDESNDFDIAIYDYRYVTSFAHLLFRKGYPNFDKTKKHVLIDRNDWISPIWANNKAYEVFDLICAGNLFKNRPYPKNIKPWAIGLTNRVMKSIDRYYDAKKEKEFSIGYNFRITHNMRSLVLENLKRDVKSLEIKSCFTEQTITEEWTEADKLYLRTSTNRHFPTYYKLINRMALFMTFGGYFEYKPIIYQPYNFIAKLLRKPHYFYARILKALKKEETPALFVFQSDNFRFWEVLYSGSCPINLNFESWNLVLPEIPKDGEHYLGIKKFHTYEFAERIKNYPKEKIHEIGQSGRNWVKEHYSPKAQAMRILNYLK